MDSTKFSLCDFGNIKSADLFEKMRQFSSFIDDARARGHEQPYLRKVIAPSSNKTSLMDGDICREVIQMNTANYLGLASHPKIIQAAIDTANKYGACQCSVPLISGTTDLHYLLERKLSEFKQVDDVAIFQTGYTANLGTISSILNSSDIVVIDKQVHYSIIDGVKLSGSKFSSFRHNDVDHFKSVLEKIRSNHKGNGILVVVESVYGIDGDLAPLPELVEIAHFYDARIMIDDAHATGVLGKSGAGLISHFNLEGKVDIVMDSLSKSLGSFGGYIGASKEVIDYLRYYAKPISFSVGLPPILVAAALASLELINEDSSLIDQLRLNIKYMKDGLMAIGAKNIEKSQSAIMSMIIGDEAKLRQISKELIEEGLWIEGIPFPAVPRGQERLRLRVNAAHTKDDLDKAITLIDQKLRYHKVYSDMHTSNLSSHATVDGVNLSLRPLSSYEDIEQLAKFIWDVEFEDEHYAIWSTIEDRIQQLTHSLKENKQIKQKAIIGEVNGKIVATGTAYLDERSKEITGERIGYIGNLFTHKEFDWACNLIVDNLTCYLSDCGANCIQAPVNLPMLIYGGGVTVSNGLGIKPFFQPFYPPNIKETLLSKGFEHEFSFPYYMYDLSTLNLSDISFNSTRIRIEELDIANWVGLVSGTCEIMNACFSKLGYFFTFEKEELEYYARSLLDILVKDLWLFAYVDDKLAGFIAGFPSNERAIRHTNGYVGVADLEELSQKYSDTSLGSIVWLGVLPEFKGLNLAEILLHKALNNFKKRNYQRVTITNELINPDTDVLELIERNGGYPADIDIEIYSKKLS